MNPAASFALGVGSLLLAITGLGALVDYRTQPETYPALPVTTIEPMAAEPDQSLNLSTPEARAAFIDSVARGVSADPSFYGYPCTVDCSGHEAGWQWAEDNGVTDELECGGNSQSFIEGCIAYVEEGQAEAEEMEDQDREVGLF